MMMMNATISFVNECKIGLAEAVNVVINAIFAKRHFPKLMVATGFPEKDI